MQVDVITDIIPQVLWCMASSLVFNTCISQAERCGENVVEVS